MVWCYLCSFCFIVVEWWSRGVAELADASDSKSDLVVEVWVQVPSPSRLEEKFLVGIA